MKRTNIAEIEEEKDTSCIFLEKEDGWACNTKLNHQQPSWTNSHKKLAINHSLSQSATFLM